MQKHYISKSSDTKTAYDNIIRMATDAHKAGYDLLNIMKPFTTTFDQSLAKPSLKSGNIRDFSVMMQNLRKVEQALEISQDKFTRKTYNAIKSYDRLYLVRVKTKSGYIKSEVSETRLKAALRLKIGKLQRDAIKSMNANSPRVFATKFGINEELAKLLPDTNRKLVQIIKLYNDMVMAMTSYKKFIDSKLDKTRSIMISLHPEKYPNLREDMDNLINVAKLIDLCFNKISETLANTKGTLETNMASLHDTYAQAINENGDNWRDSRE